MYLWLHHRVELVVGASVVGVAVTCTTTGVVEAVLTMAATDVVVPSHFTTLR